MSNTKSDQIAIHSITTPSVVDIAEKMGITKLSVLGGYGILKKEGLAIYENGNIILTELGNKKYNSDPVLDEIINLLSDIDVEIVTIKEGTRKSICHEVYTNNPGLSKRELNKILRDITGLPKRNCYVIQYNYEKLVGIK